MSNLEIGVAGALGVLVLIAARVPIGVALGGVSLLGITAMRGVDVAAGMAKTSLFEFAASWSLSAVPMFLLMGAIAHHSGISVSLFRAARLWLAALPGGLAVAANFACAVFSAASGSSVATAAAMGRISYPEMKRAGYDPGLSTGVIAAAGTLGSLIPPSILMVLFGIFAETSVSRLMIAGILPGLLTAAVYTVMIVGRCALDPSLAPRVATAHAGAQRLKALGEIWPILLLIAGIIGGIYGGIFTATEAGAVGAFLSLAIAAAQRRLGWEMLRQSLREAIVSSAKIFFVALGAVLMTRFFALSGIPYALGQVLTGLDLSPILLVLASALVYLLLGMFLEPLGLLLITLPLLLPLFKAIDLDMIWIGVLVIKYLEIGLLTPPVGLNIYVVKSTVGDEVPLTTIFRGAAWFLACEVVIVALLIAFPDISLLLPSLMN
ncbi:MAG: TRAP transporter large permease subunit [Burkholderiales bacterium]|nr:MAG: TRAP transporter large permease subunit [Burkholderiales bacterium]